MTASALFNGTVRHRRSGDRPRSFSHQVAFAYLDFEELPGLLGGRLVRRRPGLVRVRGRDLLGDACAVRELVLERTGVAAPDGPVRVLTHPRVMGTCFNPVSFYYCFDTAERLDAVVAEVTNTPWGDRHSYVLRGEGPVIRGTHPKALHVSPFQPMERIHRWAVTVPGETLSVHIENRREETSEADFDATLLLHRRELTRASLARMTARYPAGTLRVLTLIYGHALGLALRRAPHFRHPAEAGS